MAIDTQDKRLSAISTRRLPWMRRFQPQPDSSMTIEDRQQVAFVYLGISSSGSGPGTPPSPIFARSLLLRTLLDQSNFKPSFVGDENFCDNLDDSNFKPIYFPME